MGEEGRWRWKKDREGRNEGGKRDRRKVRREGRRKGGKGVDREV